MAMLKDMASVNETEVAEGIEDPESTRSGESNEEVEVVNQMRELSVHNKRKKRSSIEDAGQPNGTQGQLVENNQTQPGCQKPVETTKKNNAGPTLKEKMPLQPIQNNSQVRQTWSSSSSASSTLSQDISAKIRKEIESGKKTLLVKVTKMAVDTREMRKRRRNSTSSGISLKDFVTSSDEDETVFGSVHEDEQETEVRFITLGVDNGCASYLDSVSDFEQL